MAVDSTPAYGPSRYLPSSSISDSTAAGRALLTAASSAAQLALLGIVDVDTIEAQSLAHAKSVCNFAFPPSVWRADCVSKPGSAGSKWASVILSGTSTNVLDSAGETGGSAVMTAVNGQAQWLSVPNGLGVFGPDVMPDLVAAASRWHLEFDFRVNSTPDSNLQFGQGWIDPAGSATMFLGVNGTQAKFQFIRTGGVTANSTVNVDTARHRARMWANGGTPGTVYFSIDGETPVAKTGVAWGTTAGPYGTIVATASQNVNLFHSIYVVEGVA